MKGMELVYWYLLGLQLWLGPDSELTVATDSCVGWVEPIQALVRLKSECSNLIEIQVEASDNLTQLELRLYKYFIKNNYIII